MARQAAGMSRFDFSNAMVVVTGAGAGIGQGIAQAFHAAGGRVALGDLRKDTVERAAAELGRERTFAGAIDLIGQYQDAGVELLINRDRRNDVETRELFVSDVMPHFA